MKITAEQKYIRMTARKVRVVVDAVKDLKPADAITQLEVMNKRAALPVSKVLKQAVANATNNFNLSPSQLKISEILVNEGPTFKRFQAVSRGRAHSILKRSSHVKVILETIAAKQPVAAPKAKAEIKKASPKTTKEATKDTKTTKKAAPKKTVAKEEAKTTKTTAKKTTKSKTKKQA